MKPELLLNHFDRISDAPDAIPRLRQFILDLAVRGKLVERNPADEPASLLLDKIRAEKARLVKQGSLKHREPSGIAAASGSTFLAPLGWVLTTLGEVTYKITDGAHKTPTYVDEGVPFISVKDFSGGTLDFSNTRLIPANEHAMLYKRCDPRRGDVLIGRIGTLGKAVLVDTDRQFSLFVSVGLIRFSHEFIAPLYFRLVLNSPLVESEYNRIKVGGGTHTNKLNLGDLHSVIFPLPPFAEQQRIVAKVDELMALCNRLEATQREREIRRHRLTAASIQQLNNGESAESLRQHALFFFSHLPCLTTCQNQVQQLRQIIRNLAIQGRLVRQDPTDGSAAQLVKEITQNRERLYAAKKIPKPTQLPLISERDKPFTTPNGWCWAMLGDLCYQVSDGPHFSPQYVGPQGGVPFLSTRNVRPGSFDLSSVKYISRKDHEVFSKRIRPEKGDILYTKGGTTGLAKVNDLDFQFSVWVHLAVLRIDKQRLLPRYVELALNSPHCYAQSQRYTQGISNFDLGLTRMIKITIPLPPLPEQHRIVAKVDELIAVCDRLEAQLTASQNETSRLLEAILYHALNDSRSSPTAPQVHRPPDSNILAISIVDTMV